MRGRIGILVALALFLAVGSLSAGDNDIGPAYKEIALTVVCSVHCSEGPCNFRMTFYGQEGNVVKQQSFLNVPQDGARFLAYNGVERLVHCEVGPLDPALGRTQTGNVTDEPALVHLDPAGRVIAAMSNERASCECECPSHD